MAKVLKVRNADNTDWEIIASSIPNINEYLTESSASITYATINYVDNEINNIDALPSQSTHSGQFLTTNGTVASWATVDLSSASAAAVAAIVDSAPETLNTLNELAAALGDDANYASTVTTALGNKLDISSASSTYLTQVSASTTYATISSVVLPDTEQSVLAGQIFG